MAANKAVPYALGAVGMIVFLGIWQAAPSLRFVSSALLPKPSDIPAAFVADIKAGLWLDAVGLSLEHYALGLLCGASPPTSPSDWKRPS